MASERVAHLAAKLETETADPVTQRAAALLLRNLATALAALVEGDCSYHGNEIRIPTNGHIDAIRRIAHARRLLNL